MACSAQAKDNKDIVLSCRMYSDTVSVFKISNDKFELDEIQDGTQKTEHFVGTAIVNESTFTLKQSGDGDVVYLISREDASIIRSLRYVDHSLEIPREIDHPNAHGNCTKGKAHKPKTVF